MSFGRKKALVGAVVAILAAGPALGDVTASVVRQLGQQGYEIQSVQRTLLGRMRVVSTRDDVRRETVFDPRTGVVLRDYARRQNGAGLPGLFGGFQGGGSGDDSARSGSGGGFSGSSGSGRDDYDDEDEDDESDDDESDDDEGDDSDDDEGDDSDDEDSDDGDDDSDDDEDSDD